MGVGTILDARRVIMLAFGEHKARSSAKPSKGRSRDGIPASNLQQHPDAPFVLDAAVAAELTRVKTPWLLGACDWSERRTWCGSAVIWLCQQGREADPRSSPTRTTTSTACRTCSPNGARPTTSTSRSSDAAADDHRLARRQARRRTTSSAPRPRDDRFPKRVVVFSPHPDDDVISMGGTLIRLVRPGARGPRRLPDLRQHRGLRRRRDALRRLRERVRRGLRQGRRRVPRNLSERIRDFPATSNPARSTRAKLQQIKALIRRGEARSACRFVGIPESHIHFLDMPFYETGRVKKRNYRTRTSSLP